MANFYTETEGKCWQWIECMNGQIPDYAVIGGEDINGEPIFVGRVIHKGETIPGKVVPSHKVCYIASNNKEISFNKYQVLSSRADLKWSAPKAGRLIERAILAGRTKNGNSLFVGRKWHDSRSLVVGYVSPSQKELNYPFDCRSWKCADFEILRYRKSDIL
ncbi:natterin-3-like protein [Dinothrombium tinctorium]|uniref:Natterin-3-like protein n=1 Tax=Dinothrombium tinctorium TaxID=1965070 RepID=A0A3S3QA30_9ACAR|nr:natterin-3-like protein [Dinothrombium tinctorium]